MEEVKSALKEAQKQKLQSVLVCGFDDNGQVYMNSSINSIPYMHWLLNRSLFEVSLFEKNRPEPEAEQEKSPEDS
jgi:tryptophanyl-tRNA synthetase